MSDIKKKIGKSSLSGLLNVKKEPEPQRDPYSSGYGGRSWERNSLWEDDDWGGSPTQKFYEDSAASMQPSQPQGGRKNGPIDFYHDAGVAFVTENEMRRIKIELATQIEGALKYRNLLLSLSGQAMLRDMMDELLWSECKAKDINKPGSVGYPMVDEITGENPYVEVDDDE